MTIPDYIVHYYHSERKPFLNLSDLSNQDRDEVIVRLNTAFEKEESKRFFPGWYMPQRLEAEAAMRQRFIAKGGKPLRNAPHYFTLGFSPVFESQFLSSTEKLIFPVNHFDEELICFCLNDSLWTMAKSHDPRQHYTNRWFEGDVFSYSETVQILSQLAVNTEDAQSLQQARISFVEALVWSDFPFQLTDKKYSW